MAIEKTPKTKNVSSDKADGIGYSETSNPLMSHADVHMLSLSDFNQEIPKPKYDADISEILVALRIMNNMIPMSFPQYNFNINELNGERYNKPDGSLLLIREYDSDIIRDYYADLNAKNPKYSVHRILEHDKMTGRLRVKIEPIFRAGCQLKINVTIFDDKINNKYILIQLCEDGIVNNVTEFSGQGKAFKALFRNKYNSKPVRYMSGMDNAQGEFEMVDCLFDSDGKIARIKRYTSKKEINIQYTDNKKTIQVKTKS